MSELESFLNLFIRRFFWPLIFLAKKIYQILPLAFKNRLTTVNLELITIIFLLLTLLVSYFLPRSEIEKNKLASSRWPLSIKQHLNMATVFFNNGNLTTAQDEINKAQTLYQFLYFFDFSGQTKSQLQASQILINQPQVLQKQINYWQDILAVKPSFLDAYLHLCLYSYQLGNKDKALEYWQKAFYLDPNSEQVTELGLKVNLDN